MITIRLDANTAPLEGFEAYLKEFPQRAKEIGKEIYEEIRPFLLDELRFYPPVPPGSRYKRTFRLRNNWIVELEELPEGFRIKVQNGTRYAQWVVGSLAQNVQSAARFQRPFHARNGWPLATNTTRFWLDAFVEDFTKAFIADIGEFASTTFKRRAYTRIE